MSGGVDPSRIPKELHKSLKGPGRLRIRFKESKKSRISPSKRLRQGANKAIFLIKIVTFLQWAWKNENRLEKHATNLMNHGGNNGHEQIPIDICLSWFHNLLEHLKKTLRPGTQQS
jgi:hypothetical protein